MNELSEIINGGYCIGCGACASIQKKDISIIENSYQQYIAQINSDTNDFSQALSICPFSNQGLNEDQISEEVFDYSKGKVGNVIGYYKSLYAGHINNNDIRINTTSGGIITWVLCQLLEKNMVDAVIHIKKTQTVGKIFEYGISRTSKEVIDGAKSRYYPVEMSEVMEFVIQNEGRYVFVGLPCFTKAARKYTLQNPILKDRIKYFVGLVCGHLKSKAFAELVAWESGMHPEKLKYIDFRHKLIDKPSDNYGIRVEDIEGNNKILVARETLGTNWGLGFFKYEACDYCDDIFSETADIAVGDAWLGKYTMDSLGNSVVITRNPEIETLIRNGIKDNVLSMDTLSEDEMRNSQGGGFRHRRSGLGYRLFLKQKMKEWAPNKRVPINKNGLSFSRKIIYKYRVYLRVKSVELWKDARKKGDYSSFAKRIKFSSNVYSLLLKTVAFSKKIKLK